MHSITYVIEVFEREAARVWEVYQSSTVEGSELDITAIEQRDSEIEKCLYAIELLHDTYNAGKKKRKIVRNIF